MDENRVTGPDNPDVPSVNWNDWLTLAADALNNDNLIDCERQLVRFAQETESSTAPPAKLAEALLLFAQLACARRMYSEGHLAALGAVEFFRTLPDCVPELITSLECLAWIRSELGEHRLAVTALRQSLRLMLGLFSPHDEVLLENYLGIGDAYAALSSYERATKYYRLALQIAERQSDCFEEALCGMDGIYNCHKNLNHYEQAIEWGLKLWEVLPRQDNPRTAVAVLCGIAECYHKLGQGRQAARYLKKAKKQFESASFNTPGSRSQACYTLATTNKSMNKFVQAEEFFRLAAEAALEAPAGYYFDVTRALSGLSEMCIERDFYDEAEEALWKCVEVFQLYQGQNGRMKLRYEDQLQELLQKADTT